jgi:tRNA-splicing ligase RtcB (3'-phosphate/5'-hydroxy nucleic acid ligase)
MLGCGANRKLGVQRDRHRLGAIAVGTRDVTMTATTSRAMFNDGIPGWLDQMKKQPLGSVAKSDFAQLWREIDAVQFLGSMAGNACWAPSELVPG